MPGDPFCAHCQKRLTNLELMRDVRLDTTMGTITIPMHMMCANAVFENAELAQAVVTRLEDDYALYLSVKGKRVAVPNPGQNAN